MNVKANQCVMHQVVITVDNIVNYTDRVTLIYGDNYFQVLAI